MECLVQIAATRKALFSSEEKRNAFVNAIMQGIQDIILNTRQLSDSNCYNGFCRLLHRFRMTAPLNEMAEKQGYMDWINLIANFTQTAFQSVNNSCYYLLSFWSRIVQSMNYYQQLPEATLLRLQTIMIELTRSYISTYINTVAMRISEMLDGKAQ